MKLFVLLIGIIFTSFFLRFYHLDSNPPGLYVDEASIGVNAYSVLEKGVDEHGKSMPIFFEAFGEYKLPVYIYLTSLSFAIFGKNEFAIRFFSAFFGVATVITFYFLLRIVLTLNKKIFSERERNIVPILGAVFLALSPWHIQFSRGGFEANVALFFFLLSLTFFFYFLETKKLVYFYLTNIVGLVPLYTYSTYRVIIPIFFVGVFLYAYSKKYIPPKHLLINAFIILFVALPVIAFSLSGKGQIRFNQTSAFVEYDVKTIPEKIMKYPLIYIKNYISFFSPSFLFSSGDGIGRHQIPGYGMFFRAELLLILVGFYSLLKKRKTMLFIIVLSLLLISPIPAALSRPSPHTLRSFLLVIPLTILCAYGAYFFFEKRKRLLFLLIACVLVFESILYFHTYFTHYPKFGIPLWGQDYKEVAYVAEDFQKKGQKIIVDYKLKEIPIYFSFYTPSLSWSYGTYKDTPVNKSGTIFITPKIGTGNKGKIMHTTYQESLNHDVSAYFLEL